uniref:C2H2-type domain-containing protein n=1 Tax=Cacopsylla melanoneura TaxID=428564 RepID=A0A8D8T1U2_9HEMI
MILPRPTGCDMSTPPGTTPNKISTNLSFECKLCNKSYESPLLTKYHIHYEHGRNDPTVQNNIDKHMFIRQPEKDLFGDLLKQGDLKKTNLNSSVVISVENQAKELKTKESKAKESKVKESKAKESLTILMKPQPLHSRCFLEDIIISIITYVLYLNRFYFVFFTVKRNVCT